MARVKIDAGICGFTTEVKSASEDRQHVTLHVESDCPDVIRISKEFSGATFDAFEEIGPCRQSGSLYDTRIMRICSRLPHVACPVPAGICKALEVVAGLALPRDAHIAVFRETEPEPQVSGEPHEEG